MLIDKPEYKRNTTGIIVQSQEVAIKCDSCGEEWSSLYEYRKHKKHINDLCLKCRSKIRFKNGKINKPSKLIQCDYCKKEFKKYAAQIGEKNYCSIKCRDDSWLKRYQQLYITFKQYPNEVSYLCGLILGDGCLKKQQKRTTKITIAFDVKYPELLNYAKDIFRILQIPAHQNDHAHKNCILVCFSLPDDLLSEYNMLWNGNKFIAQPKPIDKIVNNIHFLGGLINSDGNVGSIKRKETTYEFIRFVNTCKSIVDCYIQCINNHGFECNLYSYDPIVHKKTGKLQKRSYTIVITKSKTIQQIRFLLPMIKQIKNIVAK